MGSEISSAVYTCIVSDSVAAFFLIIVIDIIGIVPVDIETPVRTCTEICGDDIALLGTILDTARDTSEWSILPNNLGIHCVQFRYLMMYNEWLCFLRIYKRCMRSHPIDE